MALLQEVPAAVIRLGGTPPASTDGRCGPNSLDVMAPRSLSCSTGSKGFDPLGTSILDYPSVRRAAHQSAQVGPNSVAIPPDAIAACEDRRTGGYGVADGWRRGNVKVRSRDNV